MDKGVKIRVEHVSKVFTIKGGLDIHALEDINLDIYENEFLAIVGPSGCGKSTLLFIIAGTIEPTEGSIYYNGKKIIGPEPNRGVVFQEDAVFPWMTVRQNVKYGPKQLKLPADKVSEIADKYLKIVGLDKYGKLWPKQLSGGMRKRVDLARAKANEPDVLLMDEPFGALDVITKQNLQVEISELFGKVKKTIFFVTHDLEEAIFLADRVIVSTERPGKIKKTVEIEFERPRSPHIKASIEFQKLREDLNANLGTSRELIDEGDKTIL